MSFGNRAAAFLGPLAGKTTAFLLENRASKLNLAQATLPYLAEREEGCCILDLDAFYSSNLETIARNFPRSNLKRVEIIIPEVGADIEATLAEIFVAASNRPLVIDSTNSLYQLLASQKPKSSSRKFAFLTAALSSWARANSSLVMANMYEREPPIRRRTAQFSGFFDVVVSVSRKPRGLGLFCKKGSAWQNRTFFLPLEN